MGLKRTVARMWYGGLALVCLIVFVGFAGRLHPMGDSLSLFRMPLGALCLLGAAIAYPPAGLRMLLLGAGGAAALTTIPPWFNSQLGGDLTVYSKNIWFANKSLPALAADIRGSRAEIVLLQEVSERNDQLLDMLVTDYPYQHLCRFSGWSGIAVLSQHPIISPPRCSAQRGLAAAQIQRGGQDIWIGSIHLPWPYPYDQAGSAAAVVAELDKMDGPVVIGGDFNIFPWASSIAQIAQTAEVTQAGPLRPTFRLNGMPLMLDHVLAPGGGKVSLRPLQGSDHRGVLATVRVTP